MEFLKTHKILTIITVAFFLAFCCFTPTFAEGSSIEISPVTKSVNLDPGAYYSDVLVVKNIGEAPFSFSISISPYQVTNGSYDPIYSLRNNYTQIVDWITVPEESFYVNPGDYVDIPYTVNVPLDTPAGAQFAVISATVDNSVEGHAVQYLSNVGMIISAEISGVTRYDGEILSKNIDGFLLQPPVSATFSLSNTGNVNAVATCTMRVTNFFNGSEAYSNADDPKTILVMPDTVRNGEISWPGSPFLGIFRVSLNLNYLDENVTVSKIVILCPLWFIVAFLLVLTVLIIAAVIKFKKRRSSRPRRSKNFGF